MELNYNVCKEIKIFMIEKDNIIKDPSNQSGCDCRLYNLISTH